MVLGLEFGKSPSNLTYPNYRPKFKNDLNTMEFLRDKKCSSTIIIDDYNVRPYLHVVENFFDGQIIGRFGVFNKLKKCENIDELIDIYSYDTR